MSGRHRKPVDRVWPIWLLPVGAAAVIWQAPADPPPAPIVAKPQIIAAPKPAQPVTVVRPVAAVKKVAPKHVRQVPLIGGRGLSVNAQRLAAQLQADYPDIPSIGGVRPCDGFNEHCQGIALDVMADPVLGDRIAADMLANPLVRFVIWKQTIRYPSGYSRVMEDRGSPNANHYTHVHIQVKP